MVVMVRIYVVNKKTVAAKNSLWLHFNDHLDLHGNTGRQRGYADGGTGMLAAFSENFYHKIGKAVDHLGLLGQSRRGIDEPQHFHDPFYLVQVTRL